MDQTNVQSQTETLRVMLDGAITALVSLGTAVVRDETHREMKRLDEVIETLGVEMEVAAVRMETKISHLHDEIDTLSVELAAAKFAGREETIREALSDQTPC